MRQMSDNINLADFLVPQAVSLHLEAQDGAGVIHLLGRKLEEAAYVRPSFVTAVLAREKIMPTGLPLGRKGNVAIPHTDPEHVIKAGLALATLIKPVSFANMEDPDEIIPVGIVFLLAIHNKDKQIDVLQQIMALIQDEATLDKLMAARDVDEVKTILKH